MLMQVHPRQRYADRLEELHALHRRLSGEVTEAAPLVGRTLEAAGDLLRRRVALGVEPAVVEAALRSLSPAGLAEWLGGLQASQVEERLRRAADRAVEAALPDAPEDAAALTAWAMQDLLSRDVLESALVALEHLAGLGRPDAAQAHQQLAGTLRSVDGGCRRQARCLTALNPQRRTEAALLDAPARERAWWFLQFSGVEHDALVAVLGGEARGVLDDDAVWAHEAVMTPRPRELNFDELLHIDLGLAPAVQALGLKARARKDPSLQKVLHALEVAVDEAPAPSPPRARTSSEPPPPRLLHHGREVKVLLFRTRLQVRVSIQPAVPGSLAAAALLTSGASLEGVPDADGLAIVVEGARLGPGSPFRLSVRLRDGRQRELELLA